MSLRCPLMSTAKRKGGANIPLSPLPPVRHSLVNMTDSLAGCAQPDAAAGTSKPATLELGMGCAPCTSQHVAFRHMESYCASMCQEHSTWHGGGGCATCVLTADKVVMSRTHGVQLELSAYVIRVTTCA